MTELLFGRLFEGVLYGKGYWILRIVSGRSAAVTRRGCGLAASSPPSGWRRCAFG